jgi:hypothetical protein
MTRQSFRLVVLTALANPSAANLVSRLRESSGTWELRSDPVLLESLPGCSNRAVP